MRDFSQENKDLWLWTMLLMQPEVVTEALLAEARAQVEKKHPSAALARVRLEAFEEGPAAQIMHIGPYAAEAPTIAKLHAFIEAKGYQRRGKHHEIYLGDPRRAAPEKLKTIVRQPVG